MQQSHGRSSMLLMTKAAKFTLKVKSVENQTAIHKKPTCPSNFNYKKKSQNKNIFALFTEQIAQYSPHQTINKEWKMVPLDGVFATICTPLAIFQLDWLLVPYFYFLFSYFNLKMKTNFQHFKLFRFNKTACSKMQIKKMNSKIYKHCWMMH